MPWPSLGVGVGQRNAQACLLRGHRQMDRDGGLTCAALLDGDGYGFHALRSWWKSLA